MAQKIHPSDVIVGGATGLGGFYCGLSREMTIALAMFAVGLSIGAGYLYRQWRGPNDA